MSLLGQLQIFFTSMKSTHKTYTDLCFTRGETGHSSRDVFQNPDELLYLKILRFLYQVSGGYYELNNYIVSECIYFSYNKKT